MQNIPTMDEAAVKEITDSVTRILLEKNQDYGGASFDLGLTGNMVHLWDKVRRYRTLVEKSFRGESPKFESVDDTLRDIIGYSIIGLIILKHETKDTK